MRLRLRIIFLFGASLGLMSLATTYSYSQAPEQAKLAILNINLISASPGPYTAQVGLALQRQNFPQINFVVIIQQVHNVPEVYDKLKPAIDNLADDLKGALINIPRPE